MLIQRVTKLINAFLNKFIDGVEENNPELLLNQLAFDMKAKIPELNRSTALIIANERAIERTIKQLEQEVTNLDKDVRALVTKGHNDLAKGKISLMLEKQNQLADEHKALESAKELSSQARKNYKNYMSEVQKKQREINRLVSLHKQNEIKKHLVELIGDYTSNDISGSLSIIKDRIIKDMDVTDVMLTESTSNNASGEAEQVLHDIEVQQVLNSYVKQVTNNISNELQPTISPKTAKSQME